MHLIIINVTIFFISQFFLDRFTESYKNPRLSVWTIDWSAAKKKELEDETTDDMVDSGDSSGSDRDISGASCGKHEGKKGRSEPGEVVGEAVSNDVG